MLSLALWLVAAATDPSELPPPPPLLEPAPPPPSSPPPSPPPPSRPTSSPRAPATPPPDTSLAVTGLDPWLVAGLQLGIVCGIDLAAASLGFLGGFAIPGVGTAAPCGVPCLGGYLATYAGDRVGRQRAPALWPMLASYLPVVVGVGAGTALFLSLLSTTGTPSFTNAGIILLVGSGLTILSAAAVPAAYALTAVPKQPWDDGSVPPDFLQPAQVAEPKEWKKKHPPTSAPPPTAMTY
jgi:hypothetical protein